MIQLSLALEGGIYCLVFVLAIRSIDAFLQRRSYLPIPITKTSEIKIKILLMLMMVTGLVLVTYWSKCMGPPNDIDLLTCIYIKPGPQLVHNVAIALFINTTLFLGGLHQQLYNGGMRKKLLRVTKRQFQWNLFKKLFIVPLSVEIVYRALLCRVVDPNLQHPTFFAFYSGTIYGFSHSINYFKFREKYQKQMAIKATAIHIAYNMIFGLYVSHFFSRTSTLISCLVIQVYANFMGYPQYFEILKGDVYNDRVRSSFPFIFRNNYLLFVWSIRMLDLLLVFVILPLSLVFVPIFLIFL